MGAKLDSANIDNLRKDASEVLDNITSLSRRLATVSKDKTSDLAKELSARFGDDLEKLQHKMEELNQDLSRVAKNVDVHVREKPYYYVAGALGLGAILGKLLSSRDK